MKSVTIKDKGKILIKVIRHKCGRYDVIIDRRVAHLEIDVRDDNNCNVIHMWGL